MVLPFFVNFSFPIWKEHRGFPETSNNYVGKKDLLCHVWQLAELTKTRLTFGDRYCVPESSYNLFTHHTKKIRQNQK